MLRSKTAGSARCRELRLSDVNSGFCSHLTNLDSRELVLHSVLSLHLELYTEGPNRSNFAVFHSCARIHSSQGLFPGPKLERRAPFRQEDIKVKRTGILATLLAMALLLSSFGCGGAAIGSLKAINLTTSGGATPNLVGTGGTVQLTATGIYTSSDTRDLSSHA